MIDTDHLLISQFFKSHEDLAINYVEKLEPEEIVHVLDILSTKEQKILLEKLSMFKGAKTLEKTDVAHAAAIIASLNSRTAHILLRAMKPTIREVILEQIKPVEAAAFRRALDYTKDKVGAYLEPFVMTLNSRMTIEAGRSAILSNKGDIKPHIFILDVNKKLTGYIDINDLMRGEDHLQLKSVQKKLKQPTMADMNVDDLLESWDHSLAHLPVTDVEGTFMGSVARSVLETIDTNFGHQKTENAAIKAGNALGDLYMIGLSSLLGNASDNNSKG